MKGNYCPKIDISDELGDDLATQNHQITEVLFLSSFNVSPRRGHLEAAYRIFEYLYFHKTGGRVVFDDAKPKVNE